MKKEHEGLSKFAEDKIISWSDYNYLDIEATSRSNAVKRFKQAFPHTRIDHVLVIRKSTTNYCGVYRIHSTQNIKMYL